ncbi:MAG: hypothetical protein P4L84_26355 [Isosphaeraceae bacterium]|nr:hypothetical protein [Isosphaeraceae bacterium]
MARRNARRAAIRRAALLALVATGLFLASWIAWQITPDGSFARNLSGLVLSAAVTATTAFVAATMATRNAMRQRSEHDTIKALESSSRSASVQLGPLEIPDIVIYSIADGSAPTASFRFPEALSEPRQDPTEWAELQKTLLPDLVSRSEASKRLFTDDPAVDMIAAAQQVHPQGQGTERVSWHVQFAETSYYKFAVLANSTPDELRAHLPDAEPLLAERAVGRARLGELVTTRIPAKVGTGTVVQTSDGFLVGMIRGDTYQIGDDASGIRKVHILGEGMLPTDVRDGRIDPKAAAWRGLYEELGSSFGEAKVEFTGMFFDLRRHQPTFCYLATIGVTFATLQTEFLTARDHWETDELVRLGPGVDDDLRRLMLGRQKTLRMASNPGVMTLILALGRLHGFREVREAFAGEL